MDYHVFRKSKKLKNKTVHRWYYYFYDPITGKKIQKACSGCKNQAEAYAFISALQPLSERTRVTIGTIAKYMYVPESDHVRRLEKLGKKPEFIDGLRVTDKETVDIVQMVLSGKVNKSLVSLLGSKGGNAMGISGADGRLIETEVKDPKLGYVGKITKININPVIDLLEKGYIPVISTVGCDLEGNAYNINGDTAAASIAGALKAERLIMMTDIVGLLKDVNDPSTLIPELSVDEIEELFKEGVISGGMIPKLKCCTDAINKGVKNVVIMDGRVPHSILLELLTDEGAGTLVKK